MLDVDYGLGHQQVPGLDDYPVFDVDIVSPELPCGCAWLVNCLIELGVGIWKPWNVRTDGDWERLAPRRYRYANAAEPLRHMLPSLAHAREFEFATSPVPRVFHYWPGFYRPTRKTILFVRDPRDALHSAWRRACRIGLCAADTPFEAFVAARYFHYPITWGEYLLLFLRIWREALTRREHLVLRYEDYRRDAAATLREATDFLGVDAGDDALSRAIAASAFEHAQPAEAARPALYPTHRAGIAYEFRSIFTPQMHAAYDGRFDGILEWLRYEPSESQSVTAHAQPSSQAMASLAKAMLHEQALPDERAWICAQLQRHASDLALDWWSQAE